MFDFIASGYIPSIVTSAVAVMLLIGYYVFVIPIMEENKMLKERITNKDKKISEITDSCVESNKTHLEHLDSLGKDATRKVESMQESILKLEASISDIVSSTTTSTEDLSRTVCDMLTTLNDYEHRLDSIQESCVSIKESHISMLGIIYGLRNNSNAVHTNGVTISPPMPSHLK